MNVSEDEFNMSNSIADAWDIVCIHSHNHGCIHMELQILLLPIITLLVTNIHFRV
jgi:hypothetical protein